MLIAGNLEGGRQVSLFMWEQRQQGTWLDIRKSNGGILDDHTKWWVPGRWSPETRPHISCRPHRPLCEFAAPKNWNEFVFCLNYDVWIEQFEELWGLKWRDQSVMLNRIKLIVCTDVYQHSLQWEGLEHKISKRKAMEKGSRTGICLSQLHLLPWRSHDTMGRC